MRLGTRRFAIGLAAFCGLASPAALAQNLGTPAIVRVEGVKTSFVRLAQGVPGVLYEPVTPGPKAEIGIFLMHSGADYLTHSGCRELSKRGYRVLCANNSNGKSGTFDDGRLDGVLREAGQGVKFLRSYPGIKKVVLFGHSGGGTLMTAYQSVAENGVKICQDAQKISKCPDNLAGLPPADGVVLADSNLGLGVMTLISLDPAVIDETSGIKLNPALDMFNPANGFKASGSTYSDAFSKKFFAAQAARNNQVIDLALKRQADIRAGKGRFVDDDVFVFPGGYIGVNKLLTSDTRFLSESRKPAPLIHADGSVTTGIVPSVRVPEGTRNPSPNYRQGAIKSTVNGFLASYAIRADKDYHYDKNGIYGVQWRSSYASPAGNAETISAPLIAIGMTGHWESLAAEVIYDHAKSADKSIAFVEGGLHGYEPCKACEKTPGQFGDTVKSTYDYVDGWLSKPGRFLP